MAKDKDKKKNKKNRDVDNDSKNITVFINDKPIVLRYKEFQDEIDVDEITKIQYENIYGESVTVAVLMNQVGALKAEAEHEYGLKKLEFEIFEADLKKRFRREASQNAGKIKMEGELVKLTESALIDAVTLDEGWQVKKKNKYRAKRNLDVVESLMWAVNSKDKKLNNLVKAVTPEEFYDQIVEGRVNGILIKKRKSLTGK